MGFLIDFFAILIVHTWHRCRLSWLEMGTRAFPEIPVFGETTVLCNFEGSEMPKRMPCAQQLPRQSSRLADIPVVQDLPLIALCRSQVSFFTRDTCSGNKTIGARRAYGRVLRPHG
jgi:hypothetical protein